MENQKKPSTSQNNKGKNQETVIPPKSNAAYNSATRELLKPNQPHDHSAVEYEEEKHENTSKSVMLQNVNESGMELQPFKDKSWQNQSPFIFQAKSAKSARHRNLSHQQVIGQNIQGGQQDRYGKNRVASRKSSQKVREQVKNQKEEILKIQGGINDWLLSDILQADSAKKRMEKFKKMQKKEREDLEKKIGERKGMEQSQQTWYDYFPLKGLIFGETKKEERSRKNSEKITGQKSKSPSKQEPPSQFSTSRAQTSLLPGGKEQFEHSQTKNILLPSINQVRPQEIKLETKQTIKIKPSDHNLPVQPSELMQELQNQASKGKTTKRKLRHAGTREIQAPPDMWHLDSNLLDINLEEFEDAEESKYEEPRTGTSSKADFYSLNLRAVSDQNVWVKKKKNYLEQKTKDLDMLLDVGQTNNSYINGSQDMRNTKQGSYYDQ